MYSSFRDNIWGADLTDMQLFSKFNKGFRFLLCVFDTYSKYTWVVPLKDKKGVSIANSFQQILNESNRKPILFFYIYIYILLTCTFTT